MEAVAFTDAKTVTVTIHKDGQDLRSRRKPPCSAATAQIHTAHGISSPPTAGNLSGASGAARNTRPAKSFALPTLARYCMRRKTEHRHTYAGSERGHFLCPREGGTLWEITFTGTEAAGMARSKKFQPTRFMLPTSHYDKDRADHAVNFIQALKHTKGVWAGQPFCCSTGRSRSSATCSAWSSPTATGNSIPRSWKLQEGRKTTGAGYAGFHPEGLENNGHADAGRSGV